MAEAPGCVVYPGWIEDPDRLFDVLTHEIAWEQHAITLYGRTTPTPRLTSWMGDSAYRYSGIVNEPTPWPKALADLRGASAASWVSTSTPAWRTCIGMALIPWVTTATTSPSSVRDRPLPPSALEIGAGSCCGIGRLASGGAGILSTW